VSNILGIGRRDAMVIAVGLTTLCFVSPRTSAESPDLLADFQHSYEIGTQTAFESFCDRHYASARLEQEALEYGGCAVRWLDFRESYGDASLDRTETRSFGEMHWFYSPAVGVWFGIGFFVDADGKVIAVALDEGVVPGFALPVEKVAPNDFEEWLEGYVAGLEAENLFSGVIAVATEDRPLIARAMGYADRERKVPNTAATTFRLASLSKMFTAAAVLQLVDDGSIRLDDTFDRHLPEYPKRVSSVVTVRHLLAHTSGIELDDSPAFNEAVLSAETVGEIIEAQIAHIHEMNEGRFENFAPLGTYDYSNEEYDILGAVLESVTGKPWTEALRELVFEPADMDYIRFDAKARGNASGYTRRRELSSPRLGARLERNDALVRPRARPAESLFSAASDLVNFARFVSEKRGRKGSAFGPATRIQSGMTEDPTMNLRTGYGFGFQVQEDSCGTSFGHNGGVPGASVTVRHWVDQGLTIAVLANVDRVAYSVAKALEVRLVQCDIQPVSSASAH
jgi:CubicO group peptidase (beta-lactamase class C family)